MKVILRRMESLGGLPVATDEPIDVDRITLGRGTDQSVQLPDMRVTLAHAEIRPQAGGGWRIECESENPVWVNGSPMMKGAIGAGDTIDLGRFRITLGEPEDGADLVLQIEERISAREEKGRRRAQYTLTLAQTTLNKRRVAWLLAALVVVPLLLLPPILRFVGKPAGASIDVAWQAGPPSAAHSPFIKACDTCHKTPFASVKNDACLACHRGQRHHSDRADILGLTGMSDAQCGSCHAEHSGRHALVARNPALCTECHANPDRRFRESHLPPVHRFDGDHPGFTLNLPAWEKGQLKRVEVAQEPGPVREQSNLVFGHDVHLARKGIASPTGTRVLLCADCHKAMGSGFAPVRMEDNCASCHRLDFDPGDPDRQLPHRAPVQVASAIRDHFARIALAGEVTEPRAPESVRLRRRPGQPLTQKQREEAMEWAEERSQEAMDDVFARRVCAECHVVEPSNDLDTPWAIAPVALTGTFLKGARFDHSAHRSVECDQCHGAELSKVASDVLIPTIANCRQCHGDPGSTGRMETACVDCHGFHIAEKMTFGEPVAKAAQ